MDYVGLKWYKCDFHLHTMSSECYENKDDTIDQWLDAVQEKELDCIAVTDHNDYRNIDEIKEKAATRGITVFPGVEVTCDSVKIHVLILFDTNKTADDVRDFLSSIDIKKDLIGKAEGTNKSIVEVCEKAKKEGCIVIPAHIDDFSSISGMSDARIKEILCRKYIDAVQVVHPDIWDCEKDEQLQIMQERYLASITEEQLCLWRLAYNKAKQTGLPMIMSSDNPHDEHSSTHGVWGIGKTYTWIKMGETPDLESLRQAFLAPGDRIKTCYETRDIPTKLPNVWVKSVHIDKLSISPYKPIDVGFNPELNSIIGGRGSGKSTIVRALAGLLRSTNCDDLQSIKKEQDEFYKITDKYGKGVLSDGSKLTTEIYRNGDLYRVSESFGKKGSDGIIIEKYNNTKGDWESVEQDYISFLALDAYTQKQIYELALSADALSDLIDKDNKELVELKDNAIARRNEFTNKIRETREIKERASVEKRVELELKDIESQIELYKKSGITDAVNVKQKYEKESKETTDYLNRLKEVGTELNLWASQQTVCDPAEKLPDEIKNILLIAKQQLENSIQNVSDIGDALINQQQVLELNIKSTQWQKEFENAQSNYLASASILEQHHLEKERLDELLEMHKQKETELKEIRELKEQIVVNQKECEKQEAKYKEVLSKIRECRINYIQGILGENSDIKIEYKKFKNKKSVEDMLLRMIPRANASTVDDIGLVADNTVKEGITYLRKLVAGIIGNEEVDDVSAYFKKAIKELDYSQIDQIMSFIPEDELQVSYLASSGKLIPLVTASPGQKTTAILAFILSYGEKPLLLDQPEDDLDNKLVYDLVVRQLKESKKHRQIIVVTHNANIPVNGDAEHIVSMDSSSRYVKVGLTGTMDKKEIRDEICNVMEGTEHAFEMRAKKYHLNTL